LEIGNWDLEIPHTKINWHSPHSTLTECCGRGLFSFDRLYFSKYASRSPLLYRKKCGEDISANFISKAKTTFAQAFASFSPALA